MGLLEDFDISPVINASEPYTRLGGSRMRPEVRERMYEASGYFMDIEELSIKAGKKAAELTGNEAAALCPGAAAGVMLAAASIILSHNEELADKLPHIPETERNEIILYDGHYLQTTRYWKQMEAAGAKVVLGGKTVSEMLDHISPRTAGFFLFPSPMYEEDLPPCEISIKELKKTGLPVAVDAAAQLPPRSNLSYYTKTLGADMAVFSGGKHIEGPQSSGIIVGKQRSIELCRSVACPNLRVGRSLKIGREEIVGFITALEIFMRESDEDRYNMQLKKLNYIKEKLHLEFAVEWNMETQGRLGTFQPLLTIRLPEGKTGEACYLCCRSCDPPVDIGYYNMGLHDGDPQMIFINAYNLYDQELDAVVDAVNTYLMS